MSTLDELDARLRRAAASGLERSDPAAVVLVERLVARARVGEGALRERLTALAAGHLDRAVARMEGEVRRLSDELLSLGESAGSHRAALSRGETLAVARAIRRAKRGGARLLGVAVERPSELALDAPARSAARPSAAPPAALHRYRAAAAEAEAELALLRSSRAMPAVAGRYHGGVVAAEALHTMERVGRAYLVAQLARFEGYAALIAMVDALEPPKAKPVARKKAKRKR
jgi:hypothetical protein